MKWIFLTLCYCFTWIPLLAQETDTIAKIYTFTDEAAEYAGGTAAMMHFISKNMVYPTCLMEPISGKCYVQFVVKADGTIGEIQIQRGVTDCPECDRAVVQLIRKMPPWEPAKVAGKPVASYYLLPVSFEL